MATVDLDNFRCLGKTEAADKLNNLLKITDSVMPHQIAVSTSCPVEEAMAVLWLLFRLEIAEAMLLVYHNDHIEDSPPILARHILDGFPDLPFICDICEKEIEEASELSYDYLFRITNKVTFTSSK